MFGHDVLFLALAASSVAALNFTSIPTLVQCETAQFNWTAGVSPYVVKVLYNEFNDGRNIADNYQETSFTWNVDFPAGQTVRIEVRDSGGDSTSVDLNIQPSSSTSCLTASAALTLQPPTSLVQCQPVELSWTGGIAPYLLQVFATSNESSILTFPSVTGTSYTWTVNFTAGLSVFFLISDSKGTTSYTTSQFTIQPGSSDCLTSSAGGSSTTPAPSTTSSAPPYPSPIGRPSGLSSGAIAGIAIGAAVATIIAAGLGFFLYRRKKSHKVGHIVDLDSNEYEDHQVTPLQPNMSQRRSSIGQHSQVPTVSPALHTSTLSDVQDGMPTSNSLSLESGMSSMFGTYDVTDRTVLSSQGQGSGGSNNAGLDQTVGMGVTGSSPLNSKQRILPQAPVQAPILMQEHDAGPVTQATETVPPMYDPQWAERNNASRPSQEQQ